jgi:hypothetical protein
MSTGLFYTPSFYHHILLIVSQPASPPTEQTDPYRLRHSLKNFTTIVPDHQQSAQ